MEAAEVAAAMGAETEASGADTADEKMSTDILLSRQVQVALESIENAVRTCYRNKTLGTAFAAESHKELVNAISYSRKLTKVLVELDGEFYPKQSKNTESVTQ